MQAAIKKDEKGISIRALEAPQTGGVLSWRLVYYAPNVQMKRHRHDTAQFSVLFTGQAHESTNKGAFDARPFVMELKPANFEHANAFGPDGALLLSINLNPDYIPYRENFPLQDWRLRSCARAKPEWALLADRMTSKKRVAAHDLEAITNDLLSALAQDEDDAPRHDAPLWLRRARDAVLETSAPIGAIARDAGVHRVHLARSFRRYFNQSVTECRREAQLSRAARLLAHDGLDVGAASYAAGFSDQSHLTRMMRREFGLTPARISKLFEA